MAEGTLGGMEELESWRDFESPRLESVGELQAKQGVNRR